LGVAPQRSSRLESADAHEVERDLRGRRAERSLMVVEVLGVRWKEVTMEARNPIKGSALVGRCSCGPMNHTIVCQFNNITIGCAAPLYLPRFISV
jgi:hypothetical protein